MWEWHGLVATCIRETRASCYMYRETGAIAATCVGGLFAIICGSGRYIYMKTWSSVLVQGRQGLVHVKERQGLVGIHVKRENGLVHTRIEEAGPSFYMH